MELRRLNYFVTLAEELHFGRAAARMHIAEPALSKQVQVRERELSKQLFVRSARVELTVAGKAFYNGCVRIVRNIDLSAAVTRSVEGKTARKIRIGTINPAAIGVLPAFLSKIARKYPYIQLLIRSASTGDIIRSLETGQINLGFIRPVENFGSLRFFSIASYEYLLAVARDRRLAAWNEIGTRTCAIRRSSDFRVKT
jgi:DNA-binding transcriptional LysR family regulator